MKSAITMVMLGLLMMSYIDIGDAAGEFGQWIASIGRKIRGISNSKRMSKTEERTINVEANQIEPFQQEIGAVVEKINIGDASKQFNKLINSTITIIKDLVTSYNVSMRMKEKAMVNEEGNHIIRFLEMTRVAVNEIKGTVKAANKKGKRDRTVCQIKSQSEAAQAAKDVSAKFIAYCNEEIKFYYLIPAMSRQSRAIKSSTDSTKANKSIKSNYAGIINALADYASECENDLITKLKYIKLNARKCVH